MAISRTLIWRRGLLAAALFALACREPAAPAATTPSSPSPASSSAPTATPASASASTGTAAALSQGIDVSGYSGTVDWTTVDAAGHSFAFAKATEGEDLKDPAFDQNWSQMKAAGMVRGAYHFYVTEDDPEAQAKFFLATVTLEPGDLAPVVDIETLGHDTSAEGLPEELHTFLGLLESHYGVKPIIYTTANFWNQYLGEGFGDYPLWVAEYDVESPKIPTGWQTWHLWQWQENAPVPGVEKGADLSKLNPAGPDLAGLVLPARPSS